MPAVDKQRLAHWRDVFTESNEEPISAGQAWVDATVHAGQENAPWRMYVGYLNGRPVATSIVMFGAGVAGVGTLPDARRTGIGAAITLKPLLDARGQGYHHAVLFSTHRGSLYRRLGFREVGSKIGIYYRELG